MLPKELESSAASADPSPSRRNLFMGLLSLGAAGLVLLLVALYGFWRLADSYPGEGGTPDHFALGVGLMGLPLLMLGLVIGLAARMIEGLRLATGTKAILEQMQRRLSYREDMLRLIADHKPGAIAIFDRNNRYLFINQHAAANIGKPAAEIMGKPLAKILSQDHAKRLDVRLAEARAADRPIECMEQVVDDKGNTRFVQMHYEVTTPFSGMTGCVLVSEEDLTTLIVERERRERMLRQVIDTLVAVVDRRDPYAAGHSGRVGQLARAIAVEMGLDANAVETAEIAGSLMNFGKVLVSRRILTKTTALDPEELQRVRDSILTSSDILAIIGFEGPVVPTLRQVLERFDGQGAPEGLKGEAILVTARIVTAANAFVAFVSPRAHRAGLSFQNALQCMMAEADRTYDKRVLIALANYIENRPNKLDWLTATQQS